MAKQVIGIGSSPNDGTGDTLRDGMTKVNANFTEVYAGDCDPAVMKAGQFQMRAAGINDQTGTTYTLVAGDNGKVVTFNNASAITVTVPSGLAVGFSCAIFQKGAGQVTLSPSSTTLRHRQSHTKTAGQYAIASLFSHVSNEFIFAGDTA